MRDLTRADIAPTRAELRSDSRREFRLLWKAGIGLAVLAGIVWVRVVFFE